PRSYAFADPVQSARLVREWTTERPTGLTGIVWYRLPVGGDRRNWPWETLRLVSRGEEDTTTAVFTATPGPGARDLHVENHGKFPVRLPSAITIHTPVIAADAAGAYRLDDHADGLRLILREDIWPWIAPDEKIPAGWLRVSEESIRIDSSITP
ncbi:MAG: DUF3142 domain-containing protein, partial [Verrucomicrobiaceae bacterium]